MSQRWVENDASEAEKAEGERLAWSKRVVRDLSILFAIIACLTAATIWLGSGRLFLTTLAVSVGGMIYMSIRYKPRGH